MALIPAPGGFIRTPPHPRHIVQVSTVTWHSVVTDQDEVQLVVLCVDGTLWSKPWEATWWKQVDTTFFGARMHQEETRKMPKKKVSKKATKSARRPTKRESKPKHRQCTVCGVRGHNKRSHEAGGSLA